MAGVARSPDPLSPATVIIQVPTRIKRKGKEKVNDEFQDKIVYPLRKARLHVEAFKSLPKGPNETESEWIFLVVKATNDRLLLEAERTHMLLELQAGPLADADVQLNVRLAAEGLRFSEKGDQEHIDMRIPREEQGILCCKRPSAQDPYDNLWAPLTSDIYPFQSPFARKGDLTGAMGGQGGDSADKPRVNPNPALYKVHQETGTILSEIQALRMLVSIIAADVRDKGAGLNLEHMAHHKIIKRWFPAHNEMGKEEVLRKWGKVPLPWRLDPEPIANYFSEKVAFYFAFISHYAMWLIVPALVGIGIFADQAVRKTPGVSYLPVIGALMALWSTMFMEAWKRRQSRHAAQWGMTNYAASEPLRPEFISTMRGKRERSNVDGKLDYRDPPCHKLTLTGTGSVTMTMLGAVIVVVGCIFWLRVVLVQKSKPNGGPIPDGWPDYITSIINAVQIQIMNYVYSHMAVWLTNRENHRTSSAYDNSLILKLAVFQCLNSYFGLVYIAAIKNNITIAGERQYCKKNADGEPDCMGELQSQLAILMLTRLLMGNFTEYLLPIILRTIGACFGRCRKGSTPDQQAAKEAFAAARKASPYEEQAQMATYDTFADYLNIMLQYGFVTLFVVAFPLAPLIALVDAIINSFTDRSRMFTSSARPVPKGASGIGAWKLIFDGLSYASAVSNLTIVVFTNRSNIFGRDLDDTGRLVFFVVAEHVILLLKYAIATFVPDTPESTEMQLKRQEYLVKKHIFGVKDVIVGEDEAKLGLEDGEGGSTDNMGGGGAATPTPDIATTGVPLSPSRPGSAQSTARDGEVPVASSYFAYAQVADPRTGSSPSSASVATNPTHGSALATPVSISPSIAVASPSTEGTGTPMVTTNQAGQVVVTSYQYGSAV